LLRKRSTAPEQSHYWATAISVGNSPYNLASHCCRTPPALAPWAKRAPGKLTPSSATRRWYGGSRTSTTLPWIGRRHRMSPPKSRSFGPPRNYGGVNMTLTSYTKAKELHRPPPTTTPPGLSCLVPCRRRLSTSRLAVPLLGRVEECPVYFDVPPGRATACSSPLARRVG
jgi:hypothetical protein